MPGRRKRQRVCERESFHTSPHLSLDRHRAFRWSPQLLQNSKVRKFCKCSFLPLLPQNRICRFISAQTARPNRKNSKTEPTLKETPMHLADLAEDAKQHARPKFASTPP